MRLYSQLMYSLVVYLIHGNDLKIRGPLLVYGGWCDWIKCCCSSNCCRGSSSNSDNSQTTTDSDSKVVQVTLTNKSETGYTYDRSHDIISFTASSGYSINAVKEKAEEKSKDESKEDSKDKGVEGSKEKGVEGTKAESEDDSNIIWKTDKKEEYATKVKASIYEGIVTIYKDANGTSKIVFKKGSDGKWIEDTQASTPKSTTNGSGGGTTQQVKQAT